MLAISPQFAYGQLPVLQRPTGLLVTLLILAGAVYLAAIGLLGLPARAGRRWWLWMLLVGLSLRAMMFFSTPILETDYYRYLWDGGVVAHGYNPYTHTPQAVLAGNAPQRLIELGDASSVVLKRVAYPQLTTVYPPVAQASFGIAHAMLPWRIEGLRLVWLILDLTVLALLIGLLRELDLPTSAVLIYWWNPLLIKEVHNSVHMEMTVLPFLVASLWLAARGRLLGGSLTLAAAVGAKLWPVILLPVLLRQSSCGPKRAAVAGIGFGLLSVVLIAPMLGWALMDNAGLRNYAGSWRTNASLFQGFHRMALWLAPNDADRVSRLVVAAILVGWIVWLCRRPAHEGQSICERALWIVAGLFLLSPTQYPWYWLWLLPMLVVRPSPGLLVLTATLPLYYLRFPLRELGYTQLFDHGVVWLQFGPALALLAWEVTNHAKQQPPSAANDS